MKNFTVLYLLLAVGFVFFACRNELNQYDKNAPGLMKKQSTTLVRQMLLRMVI